MLSHLRRTALIGVAAAVLLPAAAASAATFCVGAPSCVGTHELSLQAAIDDAGVNGAANRIELGSGTWVGVDKAGPQPLGLEIVGEGTGLTFIRSNVDGQPALWLTGAGESVSGLTVRIVTQLGASPQGLVLENGARADGIRATADAGTAGPLLRIDSGGQLSHAFVDGGTAWGVVLSDDLNPGDTSISDSEIHGAPAIGVYSAGTTTLARDRLAVTQDSYPAVLALAGTTNVHDSLVDLRNVTSGLGLAASSLNNVANPNIAARRLTVVSSGGQSAAAQVHSDAATGTPSISLADSVLRDVGVRVLRTGSGAADVALDHVDTWPAVADQVSGLALADVAPSFADPLLGADLVPQPGSPLIDRAAALTGADGTTDLAGTPRALDGDGDCTAQPDIGAFEAPAAACVTPPAPEQPPVAIPPAAKDTSAPVITGLRFLHRHGRVVAVRFKLSEAAGVTLRVGRCRTTSCARTAKAIVLRRRSAAGTTTVKLAHRLRHGRYAIRVTAVDGAGNRAVRTAARAKA
jgi:hypothetical protein